MRTAASPALAAVEPLPEASPVVAFPINATAQHDDVEIALLSFVFVGDLARVTGLVRVQGRIDVRLASIPELSLSSIDGPPLVPISAHVLPQGAMAWVGWLFRRPAGVHGNYEGRIERVTIDYRIGGRPPLSLHGPWIFRFSLPPQAAATTIAVPTE